MYNNLYGDIWGAPWRKFLIKSIIDIRTYTDIFDRFGVRNGNQIVKDNEVYDRFHHNRKYLAYKFQLCIRIHVLDETGGFDQNQLKSSIQWV